MAIAVGTGKGHPVTKRDKVERPSRKKGVRAGICALLLLIIAGIISECGLWLQRASKRVKFVREIVREVAGLAPYERRCTELLKVGRDKRALKLCKRKVREAGWLAV